MIETQLGIVHANLGQYYAQTDLSFRDRVRATLSPHWERNRDRWLPQVASHIWEIASQVTPAVSQSCIITVNEDNGTSLHEAFEMYSLRQLYGLEGQTLNDIFFPKGSGWRILEPLGLEVFQQTRYPRCCNHFGAVFQTPQGGIFYAGVSHLEDGLNPKVRSNQLARVIERGQQVSQRFPGIPRVESVDANLSSLLDKIWFQALLLKHELVSPIEEETCIVPHNEIPVLDLLAKLLRTANPVLRALKGDEFGAQMHPSHIMSLDKIILSGQVSHESPVVVAFPHRPKILSDHKAVALPVRLVS